MNHLPADNLHEMLFHIRNFKSVVSFFVDSFIEKEMCEMSSQTQEVIYWIHDKVICFGIRLYAADYTRQLKLCTKLQNTDLDICDL